MSSSYMSEAEIGYAVWLRDSSAPFAALAS
jgi:hypothetical protein